MSSTKYLKLIDNYIYLEHLDQFVILPTYPDNIQDNMQSTFTQTNALSRSAPVFSYSNSGPRTVGLQFILHRELFDAVNYNSSNLKVDLNDDYVDTLIREIQAIALPKYTAESQSVEPPKVIVRIGNEMFIKGVVVGGVQVGYMKPILADNRYAQVQINFTVYETSPYDAATVAQVGSFRGLTRTFKNGIYAE